MAEADIAYVATAGAAGLALALSAWAARLRGRLAERAQTAEAELSAARIALADRDGALAAFEDARLALTPDGHTRRLGAAAAWNAITRELAGQEWPEVDPALVVLDAVRAAAGPRLDALIDQGEPFDAVLDGAGGAWAVEGRSSAGAAWLRLSRLGLVGTAAESGLGLLADAYPAPTWITDAAGRLAWANKAWLAEMKADSIDAAREKGLSFDRGADAIVAEAGRLHQRQEGFRWTTGGGRRRAWRIVAEPAPGGAGAVLAFALDMTEAEETRDTLRRHVEAHDETLNHLADAVAIFGPSKRLAFHNTAFQQLFNIDPAWLDERPTHAELLDRLRQRRLLPEVIDYAGWKANELDFYGASEAAPDDSWSLPDGRTLRVVRQPHPLGGVLLLFSDITDELQLRSRFNAQIQVQKATLDKLNDAVAVFGSDGRIRLHNEAFDTFWNVPGEALDAASDFDAIAALCQETMPDPALWLGLKARVADPDPESRVPIAGEGRTADGRIASWQTRPLPDGATLVAFSDITARRGLEQALAAKAQALEESTALKREFVGSVSYELRTPLTTIVGYSELLETQADLPERSRQHAGAIRVAASQLAGSIDDVLDMAQIDADEMALDLGPVNVSDLLLETASRWHAEAEPNKISIILQPAPDVGVIRGDRRRLAQVLDHLMENAIGQTPAGGTVTLAARKAVGEVQLQVSDTGRGIPFHVQAHIFDRFIGRERGGPGLGLALVKALTELHGGWVALESEPGAGATFTCHLPEEAQAVSQPELRFAH